MDWEPADDLLFSLPETAGPVQFTIAATPGEGDSPPVGYSFAFEGAPPPVLTVTTGPDGVTVAAQSLAGLFPPEYLDYWADYRVERVAGWEALPGPGEAPDLVAFQPSGERVREYRLTVTAGESPGGPSKTYRLEVTQDWTAGRDRLLSEVAARRGVFQPPG